MAPDAAVIVALPGIAPVDKPVVLMPAIIGADELQFTKLVTFFVLPSVYVPVAVNCWLVPAGMDALAGATTMETSAGGRTVRFAEP